MELLFLHVGQMFILAELPDKFGNLELLQVVFQVPCMYIKWQKLMAFLLFSTPTMPQENYFHG